MPAVNINGGGNGKAAGVFCGPSLSAVASDNIKSLPTSPIHVAIVSIPLFSLTVGIHFLHHQAFNDP